MFSDFFRDENGQGIIEYGGLLAFACGLLMVFTAFASPASAGTPADFIGSTVLKILAAFGYMN